MYKERCERLMRELQMTKKQMQQQHEEDLEQELQSRKLLEKRVRSVRYLSAFGSLHPLFSLFFSFLQRFGRGEVGFCVCVGNYCRQVL